MSEPFKRHQDAARAIITHPEARLNMRAGQFCGGLMFTADPLTDKQRRWLVDLLSKHDLPALADGGEE